MSDKLRLLQVDQLRMDEVPILEKMSGYSVIDLLDMDGQVPMAVIMALAYLTERRGRPQMRKSVYLKLSTTEFMQYLQDRFEFDTVDDVDYDGWTVDELKAELSSRGLQTAGRKAQLVERLQADDGQATADPTQAG